MRVFLATSFSSQVMTDGQVNLDYREGVESIIYGIEQMGHTVFCALRDEGWAINKVDPGKAFDEDCRELDKADVLVAFVTIDPPSAGTQFEIGYARARGKRMYLLRREYDKLAYMNIGLVKQGYAEELVYSDIDEVADKLAGCFAKLPAGS